MDQKISGLTVANSYDGTDLLPALHTVGTGTNAIKSNIAIPVSAIVGAAIQGVGAAYSVVKTYSELRAMALANQLVVGTYYRIKNGGPFINNAGDVVLLAITTGEVAMHGSYITHSPDYAISSSRDYTDVFAKTGLVVGTKKGVWKAVTAKLTVANATGFLVGEKVKVNTTVYAYISGIASNVLTVIFLEAHVVSGNTIQGQTSQASSTLSANADYTDYTYQVNKGDIVIWEGKHFQKKKDNAVIAYTPGIDTAGWHELLPSDGNVGYKEEVDYIEYHLEYDYIVARADQRGNFLRCSLNVNNQYAMGRFQWGNDNYCAGNIIVDKIVDNLNLDRPTEYVTIQSQKGTQKIIFDLNNVHLNDSNPSYVRGCIPTGAVIVDAYVRYKGLSGSGSPTIQLEAEFTSTDVIQASSAITSLTGVVKPAITPFKSTTLPISGIRLRRTSVAGTTVTDGTIEVYVTYLL